MEKKVGYILKAVYLFDDTVAQNVALGSGVDIKRVKEVLKQANILEFLEVHQNWIDTIIGEGEIKLSGGESQRIVIDRAF